MESVRSTDTTEYQVQEPAQHPQCLSPQTPQVASPKGRRRAASPWPWSMENGASRNAGSVSRNGPQVGKVGSQWIELRSNPPHCVQCRVAEVTGLR